MINSKSNKCSKRHVIWGIIILTVFICNILIIGVTGSRIHLRSDSLAVEFVMDGDMVTCVNINGRFPYNKIIPTLNENTIHDSNGNILEETRTYTLEAAVSFTYMGSMKIDIENSVDTAYTYNLEFSDKTIIIAGGRILE